MSSADVPKKLEVRLQQFNLFLLNEMNLIFYIFRGNPSDT
jgi:hypothetical protein